MQKGKTKREQALEAVVLDLVSQLAASQAVIQAVHATVDPFTDLERGKATIVDGLCRAAETAVFGQNRHYAAWVIQARQLAIQQREGMLVNVREGETYDFLRKMIMDRVKEQVNGG